MRVRVRGGEIVNSPHAYMTGFRSPIASHRIASHRIASRDGWNLEYIEYRHDDPGWDCVLFRASLTSFSFFFSLQLGDVRRGDDDRPLSLDTSAVLMIGRREEGYLGRGGVRLEYDTGDGGLGIVCTYFNDEVLYVCTLTVCRDKANQGWGVLFSGCWRLVIVGT
jgi:hypothetical protein